MLMDLLVCIFLVLVLIQLIRISLYDLKAYRIKDVDLLILLFLSVCFNSITGYPIRAQVLGFVLAFSFFWVIWRRNPSAFGFGDVKLGAVIGVLVGFPDWLISILIASIIALLFALIRSIIDRESLTRPIAFAPFLCIGGVMGFLLRGLLL